MFSVLQNVAIDCADAYELARFWSGVTGRPLHPEDRPGARETQVMLAEGPVLYFNQVPEAKTTKNRLHLCLRPETSRDQEVEQAGGPGGARRVADHRTPPTSSGSASNWPIPRATSSASCAAIPTERARPPDATRRPSATVLPARVAKTAQPGQAYGGEPGECVREGAVVRRQRVPGARRQRVVVAQDALREHSGRGHG
ncbi:hypothetical protein STANM309S_02674 [Streptomyces tanashiensis]